MRIPLVIIALFVLAGITRADGAKPENIRQAVARSLPFIETEGLHWMKERKCMSCHTVTFMLWSHNEAKARGIQVDAKKLDDWTVWSVNDSFKQRNWFKLTEPNPKAPKSGLPDAIHAKLKPIIGKGFVTESDFLSAADKLFGMDELKPHRTLLVKLATLPKMGAVNDGGSVEAISQLLLGRIGVKNTRFDELIAAGPEVILKWQEADGSWKAGGQLPGQNRPRTESNEVTTAWTLLALGTLDKNDPRIGKSIDSGLAFFRKSKPGKSHESLLLHMLIERKFGKPADADLFLKDVLTRQNSDGGWSWLSGGSSDAFATGQSLYALSLAGLKSDEAPIQRAQKYLLDTQAKEGHWAVPPQAISNTTAEGRLKRLVPIYHFWGTTWAAIGLSRSLGEK